VTGKNVRLLGGHPMIAYTIVAALESNVFESVIVSTDSEEIAAIARHYGAEVPFLRPAAFATDTSPDIEWLAHLLAELNARGRTWDCFSLLRPTSPFRTADTIRRAWARFTSQTGVDSLRAVELCAQHPGKMWVVRGDRMLPLLPFETTGVGSGEAGPVPPKPRSGEAGPVPPKPRSGDGGPWHSTPYQALPRIYVQNASLEIAWARVVRERRTIAGDVLVPFLTEGYEGFDINDAYDWMIAERLLVDGSVTLPSLNTEPYATVKI